jgi:TDG/mug DNA glycosylase family protein
MRNQTQILPDLIASGLDVVFCGLNPGVEAASAGHHFLGRGNRFWRVLHLAGFTPELLTAEDDRSLLRYGCGITAAVARPTVSAQELSRDDYLEAASELADKITLYAPRFIAFLGKAGYAAMTRQRDIDWGLQRATFGGASVWVLPNPSGLNRGFSLDALVQAYRELRTATHR